MKQLALALLWLLSATVQAEDLTLRFGDSKGLFRSQLTASGQLQNLPYKIEWAEFPATAPALEALAAGAIDIRGSAAAPLIFAVAAGAQIKAVAALHLDGPREAEAILVLPNSPVRILADLRGKRIGTNKGSVGHHLVLAALQHDKLPFDFATIQYLLPADAKAALETGSIDAWSTWEPYVSIAEVQDHMRVIVDGTGLSISDGVWVVSSAAISAKRGVLGDFLQRLAKSALWALDNPEAYAQLYARQTGLSIDVTRVVAKHTRYRTVPIDDTVIREHQDVADLYLKAGVIHQPLNVAGAFDRSVYQESSSKQARSN